MGPNAVQALALKPQLFGFDSDSDPDFDTERARDDYAILRP